MSMSTKNSSCPRSCSSSITAYIELEYILFYVYDCLLNFWMKQFSVAGCNVWPESTVCNVQQSVGIVLLHSTGYKVKHLYQIVCFYHAEYDSRLSIVVGVVTPEEVVDPVRQRPLRFPLPKLLKPSF